MKLDILQEVEEKYIYKGMITTCSAYFNLTKFLNGKWYHFIFIVLFNYNKLKFHNLYDKTM